MTLQKNVKSHVFWILKNVKNVFSNSDCVCETVQHDVIVH